MPREIFDPMPATTSQLDRLRELARWPGMPADAIAYVDQRIADGLNRMQAYDLIGRLGERIARMKYEAA